MIDATGELLSDAAESIRRLEAEAPPALDPPQEDRARESLRVLGYASNGIADEFALAILAHVLDDLPIAVEIAKTRMMASELVSLVQERGVSVVCLADLPPSPSSKTRYFVRRLRAAFPDLRILLADGAHRRWRTRYAGTTRCRRESRGLDAGGDA